jgi:hypothetical protein
VTNRGFGGDGSIDDLPWASVFDPAANARALSAIQAEGFRAASRIVDRFARAVRPDGPDGGAPVGAVATNGHAAVKTNGAVNSNDAGDLSVQEFERLTRTWWSMFGQFLLRSMPSTAQQGRLVSLDVNTADPKGAVNLTATVGGSASTEVWLHNRGPDDRAEVRLQCSDLLSHEGNVIGADAVLIDSPVVPMPRRSSRGVLISIDLALEVGPGIYRGTLLASGHADLWLPVMLTVRLPET